MPWLRSVIRVVSITLPAAVMLMAAGCGGGPNGPPTIEVKGHVTYNGDAIAQGDIAFYPEPGGPGSPTAGPITNGDYALTGRSAITAGAYRVEIRAYKEPDAPVKDTAGIERPVGMVTLDQTLPAKFNTETELDKVTISTSDKSITKDYDLKD